MIIQPVVVDVSTETDRAEPGEMLALMFGVPVARFEDRGDDRIFYFEFETQDAADRAARVIDTLQRPIHEHAVITITSERRH